MSALLWRIIIAVVCVVLILAVLPPFFRLVGFGVDNDLMLILRICIAGIAVYYFVLLCITVCISVYCCVLCCVVMMCVC